MQDMGEIAAYAAYSCFSSHLFQKDGAVGNVYLAQFAMHLFAVSSIIPSRYRHGVALSLQPLSKEESLVDLVKGSQEGADSILQPLSNLIHPLHPSRRGLASFGG